MPIYWLEGHVITGCKYLTNVPATSEVGLYVYNSLLCHVVFCFGTKAQLWKDFFSNICFPPLSVVILRLFYTKALSIELSGTAKMPQRTASHRSFLYGSTGISRLIHKYQAVPMPCCAHAMFRQCRVLRESPRGSRKNPNCLSNSLTDFLLSSAATILDSRQHG